VRGEPIYRLVGVIYGMESRTLLHPVSLELSSGFDGGLSLSRGYVTMMEALADFAAAGGDEKANRRALGLA
jgi:hypothetical protein